MAYQLPCVATDVGDVHRVLGKAGVVVYPKDRVRLGQAILRMALLDNWERRELGKQARGRIQENFSLQEWLRGRKPFQARSGSHEN